PRRRRAGRAWGGCWDCESDSPGAGVGVAPPAPTRPDPDPTRPDPAIPVSADLESELAGRFEGDSTWAPGTRAGSSLGPVAGRTPVGAGSAPRAGAGRSASLEGVVG